MTLDFSKINTKDFEYFYPKVKDLPPPPPLGSLTFPSFSMTYREVLKQWYWNAHRIRVTEKQLDKLISPQREKRETTPMLIGIKPE